MGPIGYCIGSNCFLCIWEYVLCVCLYACRLSMQSSCCCCCLLPPIPPSRAGYYISSPKVAMEPMPPRAQPSSTSVVTTLYFCLVLSIYHFIDVYRYIQIYICIHILVHIHLPRIWLYREVQCLKITNWMQRNIAWRTYNILRCISKICGARFCVLLLLLLLLLSLLNLSSSSVLLYIFWSSTNLAKKNLIWMRNASSQKLKTKNEKKKR